jgi:hypothetical protein
VTEEQPSAAAEPSPRELAESGEGRQPAPLGSRDDSPRAPFPDTGGNGNGASST